MSLFVQVTDGMAAWEVFTALKRHETALGGATADTQDLVAVAAVPVTEEVVWPI